MLSGLGQALTLGKGFTGKLAEINLVLGIAKLALLVVAMVFSAAPLPFSDELGPGAMRAVGRIRHLLPCGERLLSGGPAEGLCGILAPLQGRRRGLIYRVVGWAASSLRNASLRVFLSCAIGSKVG